MRIVLDQDEVICSWVARILEWYNHDYGTSFTRQDVTDYWAMENILGPQGKPFIRSCMRYPEFYRDLDPMPGAIDGVKKLIDAGHDVVIATAIPPSAGIAFHGKLEWIRRNMPFFNTKNFIAIQRKSLLDGDILVDDGPHNIKEWIEKGAGEAWVFDSPWNKDVIANHRVSDWSSLLSGVESMNNYVEIVRSEWGRHPRNCE